MKPKSQKKDLVNISDLSREEIFNIFKEADKLKSNPAPSNVLLGKTLAIVLQKPSTRTTVSFSVGMAQLGGFPLILNSQQLQMKRGETIEDTARTLSLYVDAIMIRANKHDDVIRLSKFATKPVINGLSDREHPCQVLADLFTMAESLKLKNYQDLKKIKVAYVGDGNNIAHSLILLSSVIGMEINVSTPKNYEPDKEVIEKAKEIASQSGGKILVTGDPSSAVSQADFIYTDVWASMGKDEEREHRKKIFMPYQVNSQLLAFSKPEVKVMHCLPAHRGEEISEDVLEGKQSIVFDQAENRLHIQKAILLHLLN